MATPHVKITALAIVYNEKENIRYYLDNMSFADEIIVVDSYSTDGTVDIITNEYPAVKLYQRVFDDFSSQRNFTLQLASNDWVMFFDADERLTEKNIEEIVSAVNTTDSDALWVKRIFYYEGRPFVNTNFNQDKTARIFRKSKCHYAVDKLVHEKLVINGKSSLLKHPIHHYSFENKEDFLRKRLQYSKLKAREIVGRDFKPGWYHYIIRPSFRFFKYFILKLGFINGRRGYEIAKILGYDEYMRFVYFKEMQDEEALKTVNPLAKKILVIQQKMIGDVLASTIICNNLKKIYPQSHIDYLIYPFTKPVTDNNPNIDNLILFDPKFRDNKREFYHFLMKLQKTKYDVVIDAYGILESNIIVWFTTAKMKIGFYKPYSSYIYTHTVKDLKNPISNAGLALDNRMQLLKVLNPVDNLDNKPKIFLTQEEKERGIETIKSLYGTGFSRLYMISVLGSGEIKTYPAAYMAKLLNTITEANPGCLMVFNYIPQQQQEAEELYNLCSENTKQHIKLSLVPGGIREFLGVLYHCNALIGNEGGAVNMAKALNVPTFSIFSPWIKKEAWNSFEDGVTNVAIHLKDFKPQLYGNKSVKKMKPKSLELYREFTPELIIPALKKYVTDN